MCSNIFIVAKLLTIQDLTLVIGEEKHDYVFGCIYKYHAVI